MLPVLAVLLAALLFGTTGTSQALGPTDTTPLSVGVMRLVIGGTVLALVAGALSRRPGARPSPGWSAGAITLMALTGISLALYQPLFFLGTERNGVAIGTVVALGSAPVLAGTLESLLTRTRPATVWMVATALATAGVVLLAFGGDSAGTGGGIDAAGLAGSVGAGASFAVIAVCQRRLLSAGWDPFTVVAAMGAGAGILALAALPLVDVSWLADPRGWPMALWLGLGTIVVAYALFTWGLGGLTAATAATLTLGEPLTASVLGVLVLGEHLSPLALLGLGVLASGLVLLALGSRAPRQPAPFAVEG